MGTTFVRVRRAGKVGILAALAAAAAAAAVAAFAADVGAGSNPGIHHIKYVVVIMQENRSFDSYFGTYPGADGIPMRNGVPSVCVHDPASGRCVRPYHDPEVVNIGGPEGSESAEADINGGAMNGFIHTALTGVHKSCRDVFDPLCSKAVAQKTDVMGYYDGR